jgi:hypothetical protein
VIGFGLCDGASTLALHGKAAGLDGYVLVNPWFVEVEAGHAGGGGDQVALQGSAAEPRWVEAAPNWINILQEGLQRPGQDSESKPSGLAAEIAASLEKARVPAQLVLAARDGTAIAAQAEWASPNLPARFARPARRRSQSTATRTPSPDPGDEAALLRAVNEALQRF